MLQEVSGFHLILATYADPLQRDRLLGQLSQAQLARRVYLSRLDLTGVPTDTALPTAVAAHLAATEVPPGFRHAVMVVGVETLLAYDLAPAPGGQQGLSVFETANLQRDSFPQLCPVPVVLWLPPLATAAFAQAAPDLWHWRSATLDFARSAAALRPSEVLFPVLGAEFEPLPARDGILDRAAVLEDRLAGSDANPCAAPGLQAQRARLLGELAEIWTPLDPAKALDYAQRQREIAQRIQDGVLELDAQGVCGLLALARQEFAQAKACFEQQRRLAERAGNEPRTVAIVLGNFAELSFASGQFAEACQWLDEQMAWLERTNDPSRLARSFARLAECSYMAGEPTQAVEWSRKALRLADQTPNPVTQASALNVLGAAYQALGEPRRAISVFEQLRELGQRAGLAAAKSVALGNLGSVFLALGEARRARPLFSRALEEARAVDRYALSDRIEGALRMTLDADAIPSGSTAVLPVSPPTDDDHTTLRPPMVQVFVSSTWLDLQPERAAVAQVLQRLRETKFIGMEFFGSRDETNRVASLNEVDRSQVYVGIFGGRYGSGITEQEYRRAVELGLPCFIYFKAEPTISEAQRERDSASARRLARLKAELRREHTVGPEFTSPEGLAARCATDLHNWLVAEYLTPKLRRAAEGKGRRSEAEALLAALRDTADFDPGLLSQLKAAGFTVARGTRSAAIAGPVTDSVITTGDGNILVQQRGRGGLAVGGPSVVAGEGGIAIGGDVHGGVFLATPGTDPAQAVMAYRRTLVTSYRQLSLRGVDLGASDPTSGQKQLELDQVYVGLDTMSQVEVPDDARQRSPRREARPEPGASRVLSTLEAAITNRHCVILGDPGSGKSTFLNHLALCLASHALEPDAGWLGHLPAWPVGEGDLLPIPVVLRDFARTLPEKPGRAEVRHLWDFIVERLRAQNLEAAETPLRHALDHGQAIVLLDGLDEIPTAAHRAFVRDAVLALAGRYARCRFIVTCRTLSYEDRALKLTDFPDFKLARFDEGKINAFIAAWFADLARLKVLRAEDVPHLTASLRTAVRRPDLWQLAPNPLLLTVMALVHTHKGRLPDARALLYEDTVDILLWRWEQMKATRDAETPGLRQLLSDAGLSDVDLKRALWRLAFETHRLGVSRQRGDAAQEAALADIEETALHDALAELHPRRHECRAWVGQVIETIKLRAGLLVERVAHVFAFPHRTFQEYLAGAHLASLPDFAPRATQLAAEGPLWREVILLAVGRLVYLGGDIFKPLALVAELCPETPVNTELGWRQAWTAGDVIQEAGVQRVGSSALGRDLLVRVRNRLAQLLQTGALTPVERAAAGATLGKLGDPRPGVGLVAREGRTRLPDIDWIEIPPGPFPMGNDKPEARHDSETPRFTCRLITQPYRISRYPVTVAQYRCFVDAGGYAEPKWWPQAQAAGYWKDGKVRSREWFTLGEEEWREGPGDSGEAFRCANHPVVDVNWFEAVAFCHWLSNQLGLAVTLPTEAEWERAARDTDGRLYPWGNDAQDVGLRCNMVESGIGHTSPVGMFPNGLAACGAADMAGNVWEWCRTKWREDYKDYERRADDELAGTSARVLRGGAFDDGSDLVRCALRYRIDPYYRSRNFGFRLVASPFVPGR